MNKKLQKSILAKNLKELRKAQGYTQQNIADMLNVQRSTYAKMETGTSYGSLETLVEISLLFGVSLEFLLGLDEDTLNVRLSGETTRKFNKVCENIGITPETATKMFVQTVIRQEGIPFELR